MGRWRSTPKIALWPSHRIQWHKPAPTCTHKHTHTSLSHKHITFKKINTHYIFMCCWSGKHGKMSLVIPTEHKIKSSHLWPSHHLYLQMCLISWVNSSEEAIMLILTRWFKYEQFDSIFFKEILKLNFSNFVVSVIKGNDLKQCSELYWRHAPHQLWSYPHHDGLVPFHMRPCGGMLRIKVRDSCV